MKAKLNKKYYHIDSTIIELLKRYNFLNKSFNFEYIYFNGKKVKSISIPIFNKDFELLLGEKEEYLFVDFFNLFEIVDDYQLKFDF